MQFLILFRDDELPLSVKDVRSVLESNPGFSEVRVSSGGGSAAQATFSQGEDWTLVHLSDDLKAISLSRESSATLQAAYDLQSNLQVPLRLIDCDYTFDLHLWEYKSVAEISAAIAAARTRAEED